MQGGMKYDSFIVMFGTCAELQIGILKEEKENCLFCGFLKCIPSGIWKTNFLRYVWLKQFHSH